MIGPRFKRFFSAVFPNKMKRAFQEWLFSCLRLNWRLTSGIELKVLSPTDWSLLNDIFSEGEYDGVINLLIERVQANASGVVIDLGSNVGFFELRLFHLLQRAGIDARQVRVVAIEPDEENISEFHRRVATAGSWHSSVTVARGLVGRVKTGRATYWKTHQHHSCTADPNRKYAGAWSVSAEYVDLERLLPSGVGVDLLKCDIEGAELDFIGAYPDLLRRVAAMVIEIHNPSHVSKIRQHLCDAGLCYENIVADRTQNSVHVFAREAICGAVGARVLQAGTK